jgi:hypothetical protein
MNRSSESGMRVTTDQRGDGPRRRLEMTRPTLRLSVVVALAALMIGGLAARLLQPSMEPPRPAQIASARDDLSSRRVMPPAVFLETALDREAAWTLGLGFLHPTAAGAWMSQLSASLRFAVHDGLTPTSVEIELRPLVAASDRERQVTVTSSVDEVRTTLRGGRETVLVALDGETEQLVTISCDDVDSPIGLQLGPDRRAFCALIFGYTINVESQ